MANCSEEKDLHSDVQGGDATDTIDASKLNEQEAVNNQASEEVTKDEAHDEKNTDDEMSPDTIIKELEVFNKNLKEENKKLENELDAIKDRLTRVSAEYDNFRKRTVKEKEGIYTDACSDVLKNIFPSLDSLERAVAVEGNADDIKKGIEMTIKMFQSSLEKLQVEEIPTNEGFDPNFHNAVMHIEDENYGKNEIVEVFQKGYKRGDKVLRYSMVKVAN